MEDDEAWEDIAEEESEVIRGPQFMRVDLQLNLVLRHSLLTAMMNQGDGAAAFQGQGLMASTSLERSKTSNDVPTEESATAASTKLLQTPARPILRTRSDVASLVESPKTTRRHMLSTEIDESLQKSILHERI